MQELASVIQSMSSVGGSYSLQFARIGCPLPSCAGNNNATVAGRSGFHGGAIVVQATCSGVRVRSGLSRSSVDGLLLVGRKFSDAPAACGCRNGGRCFRRLLRACNAPAPAGRTVVAIKIILVTQRTNEQ